MGNSGDTILNIRVSQGDPIEAVPKKVGPPKKRV